MSEVIRLAEQVAEYNASNLDHAQIGEKLGGLSVSSVSNYLRIARSSPLIKQYFSKAGLPVYLCIQILQLSEHRQSLLVHICETKKINSVNLVKSVLASLKNDAPINSSAQAGGFTGKQSSLDDLASMIEVIGGQGTQASCKEIDGKAAIYLEVESFKNIMKIFRLD